ncbi:MAG: hypothetical protein KME01_14170 [Chroococcus sp. CMT-3BRIN-NPC107]|jgi:hypothetical protein|nr:hypothetical protein [Chroococcus sp. CMT-3BRIN-NPC107]
MNYSGTPILIPFLATGYLLTIYLLLSLAQRQVKKAEDSHRGQKAEI